MMEENPNAGLSNGLLPYGHNESGQSLIEALLWISLIVLVACGIASGFKAEHSHYRASLKRGLPASVNRLAGG